MELHEDEISRLPPFEVASEGVGEALEPRFREDIECKLDVAVSESGILHLVGEYLGGLLDYPVELRSFDHFTTPNSLSSAGV